MSKQPTLFQSWGSVPQKQKSKQDACVKNHTSTLSGHPGMDEMDDDLLLAMAVEESLKELEKQSSPSTNNPSGACHTLSETKKNALVKKQSALLKSVTSSEEGKPDHQSVSKQTIIDEKEAIMPDIDDIEDLPGFDKYAGRMWIYPTNLPVRDYQYSIVKEALFKNTLVVLPTGLGKTFIAAVIMYNFYRWYPQGKVIFMAPTKPLVAQQIEACYNIMGIPQADTAEMTGAMQPSERKIVWQKCRIFFLTPQVLTNDLSRNACPGHAVKCLVVDEAHKALGNHAYCQVVRELVKYSTNFRVLALSATPGTDIKSVQQVIHNLLIAHVELRSEDSKDLQQYTYERKVEKIVVPLDDELKSARDKYLQILEGVVSRLKCYGVLYNREVKSMSKFLILKARDAFRQNPPTNLQHQQVGTIEGDFALCMSLYHGYELLQLHGLRSLYNFLEGIMAGQKACGRTRSELQKNVIFCELFKSLKDKFDHIRSLDPNKSFQSQYVSTDEKPVALGHPKMKCLEKIVLDHFNKKQQELNSSSEPSSRVMIFSQYRDSVDEITEMLNRRRPLVKVMSFVGQSSVGKSNRGFTQKEQLKVMKKFREGGYNTLVSTCVGEEGLDIGDVDLIICFDAHKSPIRLVQRMGRTGRKRKGRIVMLVTEGKEEQIYNQSQFNKRSIHKAILNGTQSLVFYPNNPRMVPNGLNPECHKMHLTVQSVYSVESKGKNVHLQKNKIKDPQQNSHPRRTGKTDSSEIGLLSEEEMQYWSDHYKLPASEMAYLPESEFITLPPCKKNQNANEEGVALSLSEWMPWQNQLQPTLLTGHSDHSKLLVELMEFMALQSVLGEEEDNYGQEMALYLKEDDILKPGESNNSTNENNGILKFCVKKDIDDLKESLPFKPSVRNAKNNRIKHKELPQFDEEPLCLRSDEDELPYIHLNDSDEEQRMYSSEQTTKQYVKSTKSRDEIDHGSEDILKTKQTRTIKSNLGAFLCAEKSSTDKSERRTENNHSPSSQKDLDCVPQLNELKEVSTGIKTPQTTNYEQKTECQSVAVTEKDRCPDDNKKTVTNSRNHVGSREEEDKLSQLLPISSTMLRNIIPLEGEPECIKTPPSLKEMTVTFEQFDKTGHISPVNVLDLVVKWQRPERDDGMLGKTSISNHNQCFMMESTASDAKLDHPGIDIPSVSGDLPECLEESHTTTGLLKKSRQTKQCQLYDTITDTATDITSELKGHEIDNSENHTQPYCINRERMCGNSLQSNSDEVSATRIDTSAFVGVNSGDLAEQFTMESTIKNTELSGSATVNSVYYKSVSCTDSTMKRGQMEKAVEEESESVFTDMSFNVADFESVAVLPNKSQLTFTQALNCLDSTECMSPFISTPGKGEKKKRDIKHALRETNIEDSPSILKEDVGNVEVAPKTNTSVKKDSFQTEQPQFDLGFNLDFDLEEFEDEIIPPSPVHVTRPVSFYHVDKSSFGSENGINTTTGIKNTEAKSTPTEKPCRRTTSPLCNGKPFLNQKSKPVAVIAPSGNAKSEITDRTVNSTDTVSSCSPKGQGVNYSQLPQHERKLFFNGTNQTSIAERSASEKVGSVAKEDEISDDAEESMIKVPRIRLRNNIIESPDAPFEPKIQTSEFNPFKTPLKPALKSYRKMKLKRSRVSSDEDCDTGADEESPVIKTKLKKFTILNESTLTDCTAADAKPNNKPMNREKKPRTLPFEGRMRYSKQKYNNEFIEREAILSGSDGSLSSDESEGSDLDNFDASFINDMSQMSQTCVGGVDMKAIYLQSVRSPANRGQYNITYGKREKQDVFSQVPEQDTEYMEDSFCVPNDFEDTELVDTSTAVSILEPRQIKQQQARFNKFAELRSRKREKEKHLSERRYHSHKNNVDIVNRTYAGKKKGRVQILDSSSEEETTYKHSNNHQVEHLHTEITKLSGERGKSHIGSQRVAPSNSPPIVSMRSTLQKKHCDPVNTSDKRLTTDPSCTVTSSKCPQNAFQHNIRENKVPRMVPLQPSKLVEMPSFSLGLGDILADDDDDDDDLFANLPLPSNSKCTGASSVTSLETTTTDTVQAYTVSANYKKKPTSVVSPPIQSKEERLRLSRLKQEEFRKKFTQQKTESNTADRSGSDASANSFKVVSSSNKSLETKCGKPYNFADSSPKNSFTNIKDKVIVLVDSREVAAAQCIVSALKFNHNLHVSVKSMGNCDYIVSSRMAIERKTVSDFTNGANKKKLLDRLRLLCELFERPCLIVEKDRLKSGQKETSKSLLCSKYVENVVSSLAQTHIKLLYSDSEDETASLIAALSLQEKKKNMAICFNVELTASQEQVLKFYLSLPKMNYVLALKLMYSFTTISEFIKSPLVVLKKKAGLTDQKAEELFAYVRHKFKPGMIQVSSH